jgi:hypothetical protein
MPEQIIRDRVVEALKTAASWPGADKATIVTLATVLATAGADAEGLSYFEALAAAKPDQVLPLALAGFFGIRAGQDIPAGLVRLDEAASKDLGLPHYYRGPPWPPCRPRPATPRRQSPTWSSCWPSATKQDLSRSKIKIRQLTCMYSVHQAAFAYSLIRPPRTGFRRMCCLSTSVTVVRGASDSSSGTRCAIPWCGRCPPAFRVRT